MIEVLKQALEALDDKVINEYKVVKAITAIKEALAQEQDIAALVTGMEVSIDVSTGDHDSGNRLFGVVDLVQENQGSKHDLILLVQEPKANFKEALAQPEQEPVAIVTGDAWETDIRFLPEGMALPPDTKLYTHPPQRTWVGLAKEDRLCAKYMQDAPDGIEAVIDYIEAKLKELNT
jgi:hypothetical protein